MSKNLKVIHSVANVIPEPAPPTTAIITAPTMEQFAAAPAHYPIGMKI